MKRLILVLIMGLYLACSLWAVNWGLYSPQREKLLFPEGSQWNPHGLPHIAAREK